MFISKAETHGIHIQVKSIYIPEHSRPDQRQWIFAYTVQISNESDTAVKLMSRHWLITDGNDVVQKVEGEGVVGEQPVIESGRTYEYSSFCPLGTAFGTMRGYYQMQPAHGPAFDAEIAEFTLCQPQAVH